MIAGDDGAIFLTLSLPGYDYDDVVSLATFA